MGLVRRGGAPARLEVDWVALVVAQAEVRAQARAQAEAQARAAVERVEVQICFWRRLGLRGWVLLSLWRIGACSAGGFCGSA